VTDTLTSFVTSLASDLGAARSRVRGLFELASGAILRYSLLVLFGLAKFPEAEVLTIQPRVANSPFLGWLYAATCVPTDARMPPLPRCTLIDARRQWTYPIPEVRSLACC
jgi:Protein of unknown function, DUF417